MGMDRVDHGGLPLKPGLLQATAPAAAICPESSKSPSLPVFKGLGSRSQNCLKEPVASGSRLLLTVSLLWLLQAIMNLVPPCGRKSLCGARHMLRSKISPERKVIINLSTFWSTSTSIKAELYACVCMCATVREGETGAMRISNKRI